MVGVWGGPNNTSTGTTTTMYGFLSQPRAAAGSVTTQYGAYLDCGASGASATVTNCFQLRLGPPDVTGTIGTVYGLYQDYASAINYFGGKVGIGTTSPSGMLAISTSSASEVEQLVLQNTSTGGQSIELQKSTGATGGKLLWDNNNANLWLYSGASSNLLFGTNGQTERARLTTGGLLGLGTSTPFWSLTVASSTGPQFALTDGTASSNAWTFRSISNSFYIATSTATATSTVAALAINSNGAATFGNNLTVNGNTTLAAATSSAFAITSLTNSILSTNANGSVVASTTIGWNLLKGPASSIFAFDASGNPTATTSIGVNYLSGILPIANGGTATSTQVTDGVNYFDGTRITSGTALTFDGTNLGVGTNAPLGLLGVGAQTSMTNNASSSVITSTGSLGTALDNFNWVSEFRTTTSNVNRLLIGAHRTVAGASWTTSAWRIQPAVDNSFTGMSGNRGYLEFSLDAAGAYQGLGFSGAGNTTPDVVVSGLGRVGIGTTTPTSLLEIGNSTAGANRLYVTNANSGTGSFAGIEIRNDYHANNDSLRLLTMGTGWTSTGIYQQDAGVVIASGNLSGGLSIGAAASAPLRFYTAGTADANERMRIDSSGKVGIGTTTPGQLLSIAAADSSYSGLQVYNSTYGVDARFAASVGITNAAILYTVGANDLRFGTNNAENMRIQSGGNVGIGTTTPSRLLTISSASAPQLALTDGTASSNAWTLRSISNSLFFATSTYSATSTVAMLSFSGTNGAATFGSRATTTFTGGVNITTGCFAVNSTCVGSGSSASSTLLSDNNTFTGNLTFTKATTTAFAITSLTNRILSTNANGSVVATTSIGTNYLTGVLAIANGGTNASSQTSDGIAYYDGSKLTTNSTLSYNGSGTVTMDYVGTNALEVGDTTGSNYAFLDLKGDTTYTDYGFRVIRNNTGANTDSALLHRGTGELQISAVDAGSVVLRTSSTDRLVVDSSGNVGIGTSTPQYNLEVKSGIVGTAASLGLSASSNTANGSLGQFSFYNSGVSTEVGRISVSRTGTNFGGAMHFFTYPDSGALTESMTILGSGNVGIGTTTPNERLAVTGGFSHFGYNTTAIPTSDPLNGGLTVGWNRSSGAAEVNFYNVFNNATRAFQFSQKTGASTYTDLMTITGSGNVGIGTTTPGALIDLGIGVTPAKILLYNTGSNQYGFGLNSGELNIFGGTGGNINFRTGGSAGASSMYIESSGEIGIGNEAPLSVLSVTGPSAGSSAANAGIGGIAQFTTGTGLNTDNKIMIGFDDTNNYGWLQSTDPGTSHRTFAINPGGGNVGVGTTSPYSRLTVWSTANLFEAVNNSSSTVFLIGQNGATTTNFAISNLTNKLLSTNANGSVVATTSIGTNYLTGIMSIAQGGTATSTQITNGINYFDGTRITSKSLFTYDGTTTVLTANSANTSGNVVASAIAGTQSAGSTGVYIGMNANPTYTAVSGNTLAGLYGVQSNPRNTSSGTVTSLLGMYSLPQNTSSGIVTSMIGVQSQPQNTSTGTTTTMVGLYSVPSNTSTGTTTWMYGLLAQPRAAAGSVTTQYGAYIDCGASSASATVTTCMQLRLATPDTTGTIGTLYGLYQDSASAINYFGGKLGIGTTSPASLLSVGGSAYMTGGLGIGSNANSSGLFVAGTLFSGALTTQGIAQGTSGGYAAQEMYGTSGALLDWSATSGRDYDFRQIYTASTNDLRFVSSTTADIFTLKASGNVGIGSTSPMALLTVAGTGNAAVNIGDYFGSGYGAISLNGTANGTDYHFLAGNTVTDNTLYINRTSGGAIQFREAGGATPQMVIASGGLVGIGTTTPSRLLTLASAGSPELAIMSSDANSRLWTLQSSSGAGALPGTFQIIDRTANAARLLIDSSGNVGIGTSTPQNVLSVAGASNFMGGTLGIGAFTGAEGGQLVLGWNGAFPTGQVNRTWNMDIDSSDALRLFSINASGASNVAFSIASSTGLITIPDGATIGSNTTLTNATSTNFFATTASSTNLFAQTAALGALTATTGGFSGQVDLTGGVSGAAPTYQLDFGSYFDNSGNPSVSHINLFGGSYGLGVSSGQLNLFAGAAGGIGLFTGAVVSSPAVLVSAAGNVGIATSTPFWNLTVASSTKPQLALTDGSASSFAWTMRSINNNLYFATSTATATSTVSAFSINSSGIVSTGGSLGVGTTTPWRSLAVAGDGVFTGALSVAAVSSDTAASATLDTNSGGWSGYTIRVVASTTAASNGKTYIRVRFNASTAESLVVTNAYIGAKATSGDQYDFDTSAVQLTFDGGSTNKTISSSQSAYSDWVALSLPAGRDVVIAFYEASTVSLRAKSGKETGWLSFYRTLTGDDASTVNASGYSDWSSVNAPISVDLVETANSTPGTCSGCLLDVGSSLFMTSSGNIGIGTSTASHSLTVTRASAPQLALTDGTASSPLWTLRSISGSLYIATSTQTATSSASAFTLTSAGNLIIDGSATTCTIGNGSSATNCSSSDSRLKNSISTLTATSGLAAILRLNPVSYLWNDSMVQNGAGTSTQFGFIAQDVAQVFPNLVLLNKKGYYQLDYQGFFAPIVMAIQELSTEVRYVRGATTTMQEITGGMASSTAPWIGSFSGASPWLKDGINGITDPLVHVFKNAVYAAVGVFDSVFAKDIYATNITADNVTAKQKLCVGATCVTEAQLQALLAGAAASTGTGSGSGSTGDTGTSTPNTGTAPTGDTEAPTITVSGNNPATIDVGATYADLGATVTDNVDTNLGIKASVDGGAEIELSAITIDTSAAGTHTIKYKATDNAGNVGTATRTVVVQDPATTPPAEEPAPETTPTDTTTPSTDTSTSTPSTTDTSTSSSTDTTATDTSSGTTTTSTI
jgi:hypothetical protein